MIDWVTIVLAFVIYFSFQSIRADRGKKECTNSREHHKTTVFYTASCTFKARRPTVLLSSSPSAIPCPRALSLCPHAGNLKKPRDRRCAVSVPGMLIPNVRIPGCYRRRSAVELETIQLSNPCANSTQSTWPRLYWEEPRPRLFTRAEGEN